MEQVKLTLKITRSAFTRVYTSFRTEQSKESPDITSLQVSFALLRDKTSELNELNQKLQTLMIEAGDSEETIGREAQHADEYATKYHQAKVGLTCLLERKNELETPTPAPLQRTTTTTQESIRALKLPKIELRKFGGDIKDWLPFWSTFKKIHEDASLSREDKFQYLVQSMVKDSRAFEVVNSFPLTAGNYEKAIHSLESRFGKKDLLIEYYVRELLKLVLSKNKNMSLAITYDKLETHIRALETLGVTTEMCAAMLLPLVESSLPEEILRTWQRTRIQLIPHSDASVTVVITTAKDRLISLMTFLGREVENEEHIQMAKTCFESNDFQMTKDKNKRKSKSERDPEIATASSLLSAKEAKPQQCIFCGANHDSLSCETE